MRLFKLSALLVFSLLAFAQQASAQATLSIQGTVQKSTGATVDDGEYSLKFRLYTAETGGTALWTETQDVDIVGGVYSVLLGSSNPLSVPFDQAYFLGVTVGTGAELTPRMRLTASPYALSLLGQDNQFPSTGLVKMSAVATGQETTTATSYTVGADDHVIYLDHTANQNVTLPAATAANAGRNLMLVNKEAVAKTLTSSNYVSLDGSTSTTIPAKSAIDLQSDGSVWRQTGGYVTPTAKAYVRCGPTGQTVPAAQSPGTSVATVAFTEIEDAQNCFNNNTFTAPRAGIYRVSCFVYAGSTGWNGGNHHRIGVQRNGGSGVNYFEGGFYYPPTTFSGYFTFSVDVPLAQNQSCYIKYEHGASSSVNIVASSLGSGGNLTITEQ